jgi:diadenosine tetraphosphate (Ap4A) HIT family hydrolase
MEDFKLDDRLEKDCYIIGESGCSLLLLMNNSLVPWFIIVPRVNKHELYELEKKTQLKIQDEINLISEFIKDAFHVDKLNIAAIGNIVKQLHIHIVGRKTSDFCWPNVVWGAEGKKPYSENELSQIRETAKNRLNIHFKAIYS